MKTYDKVKQILTDYQDARDSDHKLLWRYMDEMQNGDGPRFMVDFLTWDTFTKTPIETITRCRRKLQELYPELRATEEVQKARKTMADTRGAFIYRDRPLFVD